MKSKKSIFKKSGVYKDHGRGTYSNNYHVLKAAYNEVLELVRGLAGEGKASEADKEALQLLEKVTERYFSLRRRTITNDIRTGIQLAMIMQAYKRCGIGSIAAFYYLLGEYDFKALAAVGAKILPKTVIETDEANITFASQINIKPFDGEADETGTTETTVTAKLTEAQQIELEQQVEDMLALDDGECQVELKHA